MIFEVSPEEIAELNDVDLRLLVGRLAEQEALKHNASCAGVTYGGHQNAADGGIDVRAVIEITRDGSFIPKQSSGFQVKAEDLARAAIIAEMRPSGKLRPAIKELAEHGGAYLIVSSRGSVSDISLKKRRAAMREALGDLPTKDQLHTDFFDRQRIASWVNQTPGLIPWVKERVGRPLSGWQPFGDWSSSPSDTDSEYLSGDDLRLRGAKIGDAGSSDIKDGINRLRHILAEPRGAIRLVGLSGVGKTKLVQALFDRRIGEHSLEPGSAIYADLGDHPDPVPAELLVRLQNLGQSCVLIVDNCGIDLHKKLVARLQKSSAPISIITVEYDIADETPEHTDVFKLEPASKDIIEKIVEKRYPDLTNPEVRTIADFSEGNFRVALALAETSRQGESLANLNDNELFKRLFRQKHDHDPALYRAAMACALVYSFDFETHDGETAELPILASLAGQNLADFHAHVSELSRRQLIQQRSQWRALLPHAMAHRLAKQALQDFPRATITGAFVNGEMTDRLRMSFSRRIGFLHDSVEAQKLVADWLAEDSWLSDVANLNDLGWTIFDNVAPVDPEATLACLERAAAKDAALFELAAPRTQSIVRLLRSLAYDPDHFERAINIIAKLAADGAESNNLGDAINVHSSLFTLFLSGTMASADLRADVIKKLGATGKVPDAKLAMAALRSMLQTGHFSSSYGFEFGTRKRDYGLQPRKGEEFRVWFASALDACRELEKHSHLRDEVREILGQSFSQLALMTGMADELLALAEEFHERGGWPQGWVAARGATRLLRGTDRADELEKMHGLAKRLAPQSLEERIGSYLLPKGWSSLDVVELDFDDDDKYKKAEKLANETAAEIGREIGGDIKLLREHLPVLARGESYRLVAVYRAIGQSIEDIPDAWEIVRSVTLDTLGKGSYVPALSIIEGIAARDKTAADKILNEALASEEMHALVVPLQTNAGVDQEGAKRLLAAADLETVPVHTFHHLRYWKEWIEEDPESFASLMGKIAEREGGEEVAFEIMQGLIYTRQTDKRPLSTAEKAIGRNLLLSAKFDGKSLQDSSRYENVAEACLDEQEDGDVAASICDRIVDGINQYTIYSHNFGSIIGALAEKFPRVVLDRLVARAVENPEVPELFDGRRLAKMTPASKMSTEVIFDWISEEPETRSLAVAYVLPIFQKSDGGLVGNSSFKDYSGPVEWTVEALKLLAEAPDGPAAFDIMVDRFQPTGWSGSLAAIIESRLPLFDALIQHEDEAIAKAPEDRLVRYKETLERQRDWEARNDRARDEKFEW